MLIAAALAALGGLIAFATIRRSAAVLPATQPSIVQACNSPVLAAAAASASGEDAAA